MAKSHAAEAIRKQLATQDDHAREMELSLVELMHDLRFPVARDGSILDASFVSPIVAYHLIRCGWRCDQQKRVIKPRSIVAKGVVEGAIEWVPVNEPDDPLSDLDKMTMADIQKLSPSLRAEALRRMGAPETPDLPTNSGWHVSTSLKVEDAPDTTDDGIDWTRE